MTDMNIINSDSYWNTRFAENWETCAGPTQSRFFARIAVENLPRWLIEQLKRQSLTLADWGCAQGDGTDVWASYIDTEQIAGVDFSSVAIEQASQRYPAIRFINEDWLTKCGNQGETFDVVFSSNTLEHFHKPYDALHAICSRAKKAIVLALPYKELDRIDEHFFSFLPENIPLQLANGFRLIWSRVVDCRSLPKTLWSGDQVVLAYANPNWLDSLGLTLSDCHIEQFDAATEIDRLNTILAGYDGKIVALAQTIAERDGEIASLTRAVAERDGKIASLTHAVAERDGKIRSFISSRSWRLTRPIRLVSRLVGPILSQNERYKFLKTIYWRLPEALRHKLNRQRHAYVAKRILHNGAIKSQSSSSSTDGCTIEQNEWLIKANQAERIAIIPCGFEFDELVNQRPINAAKYFADQGYFVLFVAWQWSHQDVLSKGCGEVWSNVYQIPLFEFIAKAEKLDHHNEFSLFMVTMPAPALVNLIPSLRQRGLAIVYDIMDEWEAFSHAGQAPWFLTSVEVSLVLQSDYVCGVSPSLRDKFSYLRSDIGVIGNGYTPSVIGVEHKGIAGSQRGDNWIVGYFGHLTDAWFDWKLVFDLARNRPDVTFDIIGYGEPDWARHEAAELPNIRLLGKVLPKELYRYTSRWSVGIIPFVEGILAEAVDPIKIYEYLYFGVPAVVTGIRHLQDYPMTYFSEREDILDSLDHAFKCVCKSDELDLFLQQTTWQARFDTLVKQVKKYQNIRHLYAN